MSVSQSVISPLSGVTPNSSSSVEHLAIKKFKLRLAFSDPRYHERSCRVFGLGCQYIGGRGGSDDGQGVTIYRRGGVLSAMRTGRTWEPIIDSIKRLALSPSVGTRDVPQRGEGESEILVVPDFAATSAE